MLIAIQSLFVVFVRNNRQTKLSTIHLFNLLGIQRTDKATLHLQRGGQLARGEREVSLENGELLNSTHHTKQEEDTFEHY